jgi:hypothetical protein
MFGEANQVKNDTIALSLQPLHSPLERVSLGF